MTQHDLRIGDRRHRIQDERHIRAAQMATTHAREHFGYKRERRAIMMLKCTVFAVLVIGTVWAVAVVS